MEAASTPVEPMQNLAIALASYKYDRKSFEPLYEAIREEIRAFDPENKFGNYLDAHLQRVRTQTEKFMIYLGYSKDIAEKAGDAFALHDLGKILQDPALWLITKEKRDRSDFEKAERPKHGALGPVKLEQIMQKIGFVPNADQAAHLDVVRYFMLYHHERLNGSGTYKMPGKDMHPILRIVTIIDALDGKANKPGRNIDEGLVDLQSAKHDGEFDKGFMNALGNFLKGQPAPPLAFSLNN